MIKFGGCKAWFLIKQQQNIVFQEIYRFFPLSAFLNEEAKIPPSQQFNIKMFPFSSPSTPSSQLAFSSLFKFCQTPVNDIESQTKSIDGNLCESFEGLMKKQEPEQSTRNTTWSQSQKQVAAACNVEKDGQNQNKQNVKHFTTVWNFHQENSQTNKIKNISTQKVEKITQQKIEALKKSFIEKRNQKLKSFRNLLPPVYSTKLPQDLLQILQIAQKIDRYLIQKKSIQYTDNVHNVFKVVFSDEQMSLIWSTVKKLIYLDANYYKIRSDPLKNLCIGLNKNDKNLLMRKKRLRNLAIEYYRAHKNSFSLQNIPEAFIEPVKCTRFYPENLNSSPKAAQKKLKPQYENYIKSQVKLKQVKILEQIHSKSSASPSSENQQALPCPKQLAQFCEEISQVYSERGFGHMYKATLVQNLRKKSSFSLQKIFSLIKYITQEGLFLQVLMKSGCQIFRIIQKQKPQLLEVLNLKRNNKDL